MAWTRYVASAVSARLPRASKVPTESLELIVFASLCVLSLVLLLVMLRRRRKPGYARLENDEAEEQLPVATRRDTVDASHYKIAEEEKQYHF